mmetsp:Transcript_88889/g.143997  ORF Transcript_88889/g.143997 Transcript_88889/m.143997 type:complete len:282 (-) Transcript_88889:1466-2311(-)
MMRIKRSTAMLTFVLTNKLAMSTASDTITTKKSNILSGKFSRKWLRKPSWATILITSSTEKMTEKVTSAAFKNLDISSEILRRLRGQRSSSRTMHSASQQLSADKKPGRMGTALPWKLSIAIVIVLPAMQSRTATSKRGATILSKVSSAWPTGTFSFSKCATPSNCARKFSWAGPSDEPHPMMLPIPTSIPSGFMARLGDPPGVRAEFAITRLAAETRVHSPTSGPNLMTTLRSIARESSSLETSEPHSSITCGYVTNWRKACDTQFSLFLGGCIESKNLT